MAHGAGQREQEKEGMARRQCADQQRQQQGRRQVHQQIPMAAQPGRHQGTALNQAGHGLPAGLQHAADLVSPSYLQGVGVPPS